MSSDDFFREMTEQSEIKSQIVSRYFIIWAKIIAQARKPERIGYIDLFSGPGIYADGKESTPIKILNRAIAEPMIADRLQCFFNDKDKENIDKLKTIMSSSLDIEKLRYKPIFTAVEVGDHLIGKLNKIGDIPSLLFIDPWGYKGLSLRLIQSVIQHWGSECIFFFNYNRINMALDNDVLLKTLSSLFGEKHFSDLLWDLRFGNAKLDRETLIMERIAQSLNDIGGKYIITFRFKTRDGSRTSHYLIFVSKNFRGFEIMKEEMAKLSQRNQDGTYSFEYSPLPPKGSGQGWLLAPADPLDKLCDDLLKAFAGREMTMYEVFEEHSIHTKFIKNDYKEALKRLSNEGKIIDFNRKRKDKFGDNILIRFP